jgi:hypothetical protein
MYCKEIKMALSYDNCSFPCKKEKDYLKGNLITQRLNYNINYMGCRAAFGLIGEFLLLIRRTSFGGRLYLFSCVKIRPAFRRAASPIQIF